MEDEQEGKQRGRVVCQSIQIYYTPSLSGIHTAETSAGSQLSQAEKKEINTLHQGTRVRVHGECEDGNKE